jgi:hypothetical protein
MTDIGELAPGAMDRVTSLAKRVFRAAPFVGPLAAEIIGNIIPNQRADRIVRFVQKLDERLKDLEQEALRRRTSDPQFVDIIEDAFFQAAKAVSDERLDHIANVVANGISAEELNHAETKRMLWLLEQLNDSEIVILRSKLALTRGDFDTDADFRAKHKQLLAPDTTHMGSSDEEFEEAALKASYRQHLADLGLVRQHFKRPRKGELPDFDDKTGMLKASGTAITRLGRMFLRYLNLIPEWYQH